MNQDDGIYDGWSMGQWIFNFLFPEDFELFPHHHINSGKTEDLAISIWFFSHVIFLFWVYYMTGRKKPLPSWYPKKLNLKENADYTFRCILLH